MGFCVPETSGFAGNPGDHIRGCQRHLCEHDVDCGEADTCALTRIGIRNCTDVCLDKRCGPNADCIGTGHRASCICRPGFEGIADDIREGCLRKLLYPLHMIEKEAYLATYLSFIA